MSRSLQTALVGCCASAIAFEADASGSPLTSEGMLMLASILALWLCIATASLVIAIRRCSRRGPGGLWYLLVPAEVAVITYILLSWLDGLVQGGTTLIVLALGAELVAWLIAHLVHLEPHGHAERKTPRGA